MGIEEIWRLPACGLLIFWVGACLGSFFELCIMRIPRGVSVIWPRSRCDCGRPIPFYLNLPIIGWLLLRGRARCCGRKLEVSYLLVELLTACCYLGLWYRYGLAEFCFYGVLLGILLIASGIDFATMEIPDRFSVGGTLLGVIGSLYLAHVNGGNLFEAGICSVEGLLMGSGILLWLAVYTEILLKKEAVGFGDVKLMGCIGAFLGIKGAIFALFGGASLGLVTIFPIWWMCQRKKEKIKGDTALPFGPFLALGAMSYLYFRPMIDNYFAQLEYLFC